MHRTRHILNLVLIYDSLHPELCSVVGDMLSEMLISQKVCLYNLSTKNMFFFFNL